MYNKLFYIIEGKKIPYIRGGKGCFAAGTKISTPYGYKNIEDIKVGDKVVCFDFLGDIQVSCVTETFYHPKDTILKIILEDKSEIYTTPNHWFVNPDNMFMEVGDFREGEYLVHQDRDKLQIKSMEILLDEAPVYNFTVAKYHTYIANNIRVHNKGGGKGATSTPTESPNTLFSTDIIFLLSAIGEGPIYRVNPNGPQDIEINESSIDDLLLLNTTGGADSSVFGYSSTTGTITQGSLGIFGDKVVIPQFFTNPVELKYGNLTGIPASKITLQQTSSADMDEIQFIFSIAGLQRMDDDGNIFGHSISVRISLYNSLGTTLIRTVDKTVTGKTNVPYRFVIPIIIAESQKDSNGYKFTISKTSTETDTAKLQDSISVVGWQEVLTQKQYYPRTALIGYGLKAHGEYVGGVPNFTSMIKGLLCKVPTNYNQPILSNGDIDWREIEIIDSHRTTYGYRLQKTGDTVQYDANPILYDGLWDGSFVYSYTQNPVWILYDLLTNTTYGLGIPEENVDKFKFYKVAQYCDAVNSSTGAWEGVLGIADGSYRYKPRTLFSNVREILIGYPEGTGIRERRFITDVSIYAQGQVVDIITQISATFRGILFYSGGKLSLNVDLPEDTPLAIFNESNIIKGSVAISGTKESELLTGVEVSYIEPTNHFKRDVVRIDDSVAFNERTQIENVKTLDLVGVTRRSQAIRFAQYLLASSKYLRRTITFKTTIEAINLTIGDVIAVSQRLPGTAWGYGGRVYSNSSVGSGVVQLEHFTSPAIASSVFTANTNPLGLRVMKQDSDRVDLYIISNNSFSFIATGNTITGADVVQVDILKTMNRTTKVFNSANTFLANNVPIRSDIWTLGEIDPDSFYQNQNDKLFKITSLDRDESEQINITAVEYVSNVYIDSDTIISYVPTKYTDVISSFSVPPSPDLFLRAKLKRLPDGSVINEVDVFATYDYAAYPYRLSTEFQYASPGEIYDIEGTY